MVRMRKRRSSIQIARDLYCGRSSLYGLHAVTMGLGIFGVGLGFAGGDWRIMMCLAMLWPCLSEHIEAYYTRTYGRVESDPQFLPRQRYLWFAAVALGLICDGSMLLDRTLHIPFSVLGVAGAVGLSAISLFKHGWRSYYIVLGLLAVGANAAIALRFPETAQVWVNQGASPLMILGIAFVAGGICDHVVLSTPITGSPRLTILGALSVCSRASTTSLQWSTGMTPAEIADLIAQLEERGEIEVETADGRWLRLTPTGHKRIMAALNHQKRIYTL